MAVSSQSRQRRDPVTSGSGEQMELGGLCEVTQGVMVGQHACVQACVYTNGHAYTHSPAWAVEAESSAWRTELTLEAAVLLAPRQQVRGKEGLAGEHKWDPQLPNMWMAFNCFPQRCSGPC